MLVIISLHRSLQRLCAATSLAVVLGLVFIRAACAVALTLAVLICAPVWAQTHTATLSFSMTPATPTFADTETVAVTLQGAIGLPLPTGTVSYTIDGGAGKTAPVTPTNSTSTTAAAYIAVPPLPPGSHAVAITYNGDGTYLPSPSPTNDTFTVADLPLSFLYGYYEGGPYLDIYYNGGYPEFFGVSGIAIDAHENEYLAYGLTIQGNATSPTPQIIKIPTPNLRAQTVPVTGIGQDVQLAVDAAGNLYLADPHNGRVVEHPVTGSQSNLAIAGLRTPASITYDAANDTLFILDTGLGGVVSYDLATKTKNTIFSGVTGLAAAVAVDGKGSVYYVVDQQLMVRRPDGTITPIFGQFLSASYGGPISLAYNELTGDLWISSTASGGESYIKLDKFHHASSAGYDGGQSQQIALDSFGEMYASGSSVISPGPAAADTGPGDAESIQGYTGEIPYAVFNLPYSETSQTGVYGSSRSTIYGDAGDQDIAFGSTQYPFTYTISNGTSLTIPSHGIGFGSNLALSQGVASPLPGTFSNIGGLAYYAPQAGSVTTLYISNKVDNTVTSVAFESGPSGVSLSGSNPQNTLGFSGLRQPTQMAVDGAANVYVLDQGAAAGTRIVRLDDTGKNQSLPYTADMGDPAGYVKNVTAFTLDGPTNLYLGGSDASGKGVIARLDPLGNEFKLASGLGVPAAMAIDATYNLFAIDTSGTLVKVDRAGDVTTLATGLPATTSLSIDPSDTVFLAGETAKTVLAIAPDGTQTPVTLPGITNPVAATIDGLGNYYFGDGTANQIILNFRSQANLNFGTVAVGSTANIPDTLTNVGNLPMASLTPVGGYAGPTNPATYTPYSIASATTDSCEFLASSNYQPNGSPTDLAPGQLCNVILRYAPTTAEQDLSSIDVSGSNESKSGFISETGSGYAQWNLTGTAAVGAPAPNAVLTPQTLAFGNVTVGSSSSAQTAILSNTGNATLPITSITITGDTSGSFSETNTCGSSLAASASCTISITFKATAAGSASASLSVIDSVGTQTSTLTGTGTTLVTGPAATLTPTTLAFGTVTTGTKSTAQTATLSNTGNAALAITGITLMGTDASVFSSTNTCGTSLAAGAKCSISIVFAPIATGAVSASLSVVDNAPGSPQTSALTGTGSAPVVTPADFSVAATPSTQSVSAGSSAAYTVTVTSVDGSFAQPVSLSASGLPPGATISFAPASVTPGGAGATSVATIQTSTQTAALHEPTKTLTMPRWPFAAPVLAALFFLPFRRMRRWRALLCVALFSILLGGLSGCGGGFGLASSAPKPSTYTITVTGTSGSITHTTSVQMTVVQNAAE